MSLYRYVAAVSLALSIYLSLSLSASTSLRLPQSHQNVSLSSTYIYADVNPLHYTTQRIGLLRGLGCTVEIKTMLCTKGEQRNVPRG